VPRAAAKQAQYHRVNLAARGPRVGQRERARGAGYGKAAANASGIWGITRRMNRPTRLAAARIAVMLALGLALGGCFTETYTRGYILPDGALEQIPVGSTQEQVLIVLGTPSTVATLSGEAFYYISQRAERPIGFMPQQVVDQRVIAVYFDKSRRVERLANYGLKDGKGFDFISRTPPTRGQGLSHVQPNVKNFQPGAQTPHCPTCG